MKLPRHKLSGGVRVIKDGGSDRAATTPCDPTFDVIQFGNYRIDHDTEQWILRAVHGSPRNGVQRYRPLAYCATLTGLKNALRREIGDDLPADLASWLDTLPEFFPFREARRRSDWKLNGE